MTPMTRKILLLCVFVFSPVREAAAEHVPPGRQAHHYRGKEARSWSACPIETMGLSNGNALQFYSRAAAAQAHIELDQVGPCQAWRQLKANHDSCCKLNLSGVNAGFGKSTHFSA